MFLHICNQNSENGFFVSHEHVLIVARTPIVLLLTGNEIKTAVSSRASTEIGQHKYK